MLFLPIIARKKLLQGYEYGFSAPQRLFVSNVPHPYIWSGAVCRARDFFEMANDAALLCRCGEGSFCPVLVWR
jgi:hypothetical protein